MDIAPFLILLSIIVSFFAVLALIWSISSNQYEDLEGEANRILFDKDNNKE